NHLADPLPAIGLFLIMAGFVLISSLFVLMEKSLHLLSSARESTHLYANACRIGMILPLIGVGMMVEFVISNHHLSLWIMDTGMNVMTAEWIFRILAAGIVALLFITCCKFVPKVLFEKLSGYFLNRRRNTPDLDLKKSSLLSQNILDFSSRTAREIMIPRTEMICLNTDWTIHENLKIASIEMRTRYPVCTGDKDHIIGFVHIKDLFMSGIEDYAATIRPILSVPESTSIDLLLKQMKDSKTQISIVIDEYGGTSGLVTLEDIVEEIVGEIQDEFDNERPLVEYLGDDTYSVDGLMLIEELNAHLDLSLTDCQYDTLGGWLFSEFESFPPQKGDCIINGSYQFCIEEMEHLRISRILLTRQHVSNEQTGT
ncbi:hemolysin family protein, partial [Paenibacillus sp. Marseille-Q4541]|uniref:hemolysin family protein n=1 Tax=Paenibacillus sp. Marseille-Q4541 TaxID=2831522 RepID=UPI001BA52C19